MRIRTVQLQCACDDDYRTLCAAMQSLEKRMAKTERLVVRATYAAASARSRLSAIYHNEKHYWLKKKPRRDSIRSEQARAGKAGRGEP